jgi:hypothetical protein
MTHPAATVFITALRSLTEAMADMQPLVRQAVQPIKPQDQTRQKPESALARQRRSLEEMTPQRQLLEEMNHERQLQRQQQPMRLGK